MRHRKEWNGRCLECMQDARDGGDWPVCSHAEPAGEPNADHCAWCGHEVTA